MSRRLLSLFLAAGLAVIPAAQASAYGTAQSDGPRVSWSGSIGRQALCAPVALSKNSMGLPLPAELRAILNSNLIYSVGRYVTPTVWSVYVYDASKSTWWLTATLAIGVLTGLAPTFLGSLVDRLDPWTSYRRSMRAVIAIPLGLAVAGFMNVPLPPLVLAMTGLVEGLLVGFIALNRIKVIQLAAARYGDEMRKRVMLIGQEQASVIQVVGSLVGAASFALVAGHWSRQAFPIFFLGLAAMNWTADRFVRSLAVPQTQAPGPARKLELPWKALMREPELSKGMLLYFVGLLLIPIPSAVPLIVIPGANLAAAGWRTGLLTLAFFIGRWISIAAQKRWPYEKNEPFVWTSLFGISGILLLALGSATHDAVAFTLVMLLGASRNVAQQFVTMKMASVEVAKTGRLAGLFSSTVYVGMSAALILFQGSLSWWGVREALVSHGLALLSAGAILGAAAGVKTLRGAA